MSILFFVLTLGTVVADSTEPAPPVSGYDVRVHARQDLEWLSEAAAGKPAPEIALNARRLAVDMRNAASALREGFPGVEITYSPLIGSAEVVRIARGIPLEGDSTAEGVERFFRAHAAVYGLGNDEPTTGLEIRGVSFNRGSGLQAVRLRQLVHGVPVFQSETWVTVDPDGRLRRTVGRLVPGAHRAPRAGGRWPAPDEALRAALRSVGLDTDGVRIRSKRSDREGWPVELHADHPSVRGPVPTRRVYFPLLPGVLVPAWSQVVSLAGLQAWYTVVDARTGTLLFRKKLEARASTEEARFSVYAQPSGIPADSPAPASPTTAVPGSGQQFPSISRTIVSMLASQDPVASPDGWIPDGGETTTGNNVDAYLDRNGDDAPDPGSLDVDGRPRGIRDAQSNRRDFLGSSGQVRYDYTPAPDGNDPDAGDEPSLEAFQRGVVTQLFYTSNWFHDRFYALGFDEVAGNYQSDNFGRGGLGADPVLMEAQVLADSVVDFGAITTPAPDGISAVVRIGQSATPTPDRDGSLDAGVVFHELAHTVTTRMIGDSAGLNWNPGGGMGEGWSNFYSLALLNPGPTDDPDGRYVVSPYRTYRSPTTYTDNYVYGYGRFPYSTDNAINPLTWADADDITVDLSGGIPPCPLGFEVFGAFEVHMLGEIWGLSLWEVRSRIIAANGGDVAAGNEVMLEIVTDALKMTPIDPTFIQGRDAVLDADCAANACANEESIWGGFADRGLGYGATASLGIARHIGVKESFDLPVLDVAGVTVDDLSGNGSGFVEPGETVSITVELLNPWRESGKGVASVTATLTTSSPEVTVLDGSSTYGALPAQGTAVGDPFSFSVAPTAGCGGPLHFSLETTSALGTGSVPFTLRIGSPAGPGAPVTWTRTVPGGLDIPSYDGRGAVDTFTVSEDLEIQDLDFVVEDLRHTGVGDLTVELKGPSGLGMDLIYRIYGCTPGLGCGDGRNDGNDFIQTRIDDESVNDLMSAGSEAAPFTGDWFPVLGSSFWSHPDPEGQLGNFDGLGTEGDWHVFVADVRDFDVGDSGVLSSWSLVVTPTAFDCCVDGVPSDIVNLRFLADAAIEWDPDAGVGTLYDVMRGRVDELPTGSGASEVCLDSGRVETTFDSGSDPAPGVAYYYLVRGSNACGGGTYGLATSGERTITICP
jgi:subtilisin-like proprotein convertase family protein